jgi:hypothetical protein
MEVVHFSLVVHHQLIQRLLSFQMASNNSFNVFMDHEFLHTVVKESQEDRAGNCDLFAGNELRWRTR